MEENPEIYREPKYTMRWLGLQSLFVLEISFVLALIASGIDSFASGRVESGLLHSARYTMLSDSIVYCFAAIAITSMSLMLMEDALLQKGWHCNGRYPNRIIYKLLHSPLTLNLCAPVRKFDSFHRSRSNDVRFAASQTLMNHGTRRKLLGCAV